MTLGYQTYGTGGHKVIVLHGWFGDHTMFAPMRSALNRDTYLAAIHGNGEGAAAVGTLPYAVLDGFQRLRVDFRLWRDEKDADARRWLEQRSAQPVRLVPATRLDWLFTVGGWGWRRWRPSPSWPGPSSTFPRRCITPGSSRCRVSRR